MLVHGKGAASALKNTRMPVATAHHGRTRASGTRLALAIFLLITVTGIMIMIVTVTVMIS